MTKNHELARLVQCLRQAAVAATDNPKETTMTRFTRHLAATTATALLSVLLLAGAVGPAYQPTLAPVAGPVA